MKISELLRLAAERVTFTASRPAEREHHKRQHYACFAITAAGKLNGVPEDRIRQAGSVFTDVMRTEDEQWGSAWLYCPELAVREQQSLRCMALLFAAEAAESEGL